MKPSIALLLAKSMVICNHASRRLAMSITTIASIILKIFSILKR